MNRVALPYSTRTSGIDILDFDNLYRVRDMDSQIHYLNQDDGTFYKLLSLFSTEEPANQAVYYWMEDDMLDIHTQVNYAAGYAATVTSIVVDDAKLFVVNSILVCQRTLEKMFVTAVAYGSNTITVTRGFAGTAKQALVDNDILISLGEGLPELADANEGTGRLPEGLAYNYISRISTGFTVSHMQEVAAMIDGIGQVPWEVVNKMQETKRKINKALIFNSRALETTTDGPLYISQGFLNYVQENVLNLDGYSNNLEWHIVNDWLYPIFEAKASSMTKVIDAGSDLFANLQRCAYNAGRLDERGAYYEPTLGTNVMTIRTDEGNTVQVMLDKWGFPSREGLAGWGILIDMAHCSLKEYVNEPLSWRQNIQAASSHVRQDELWGTFSLKLMHPSCHGYIRGAAPRSISR